MNDKISQKCKPSIKEIEDKIAIEDLKYKEFIDFQKAENDKHQSFVDDIEEKISAENLNANKISESLMKEK